MEIWIMNHYAVAPDSPGGSRHFDFAKEMVKRGHRVTIIASGFNHWNKIDRFHGKAAYQTEMIDGVRFIWVSTPRYERNDLKRIWNMIIFFFRTVRLSADSKPDLIVGSSPHLLTPLAAWILSKRFHVPFVMEVRDLWPETLVRIHRPPPQPILEFLYVLERFLYKKSALIVSMIHSIENYFTDRRISPPPIVYVPNPVNTDRFRNVQDSNEIISALNALHAGKKFVFGYAGAHGPANILETVIDAAARLPADSNIQIVLIGDGPSKPELQRRGSRFSHISFFPAITRDAVPRILSQLDALIFSVHPALESTLGSPNKLLDYMASAKPILCAGKIPGDPVGQAGCGLSIEPQNPRRLCQAMLEMSNYSPEKLKTLGLRGREYAIERHDLSRLTERLLKALERLK